MLRRLYTGAMAITTQQLPASPDHFIVTWNNDDDASIRLMDVGGEEAGAWSCNYHDLGRGGMSMMLDLVSDLSKLLDITVVIIGCPGVSSELDSIWR